MKRVYTLYRVSTKKQVDTGEDNKKEIPMQRQKCREFSASMPDWVIKKEFVEMGVSGFKVSANSRDAIQELKTAAINKEFDILLVFMFDRIGRIDNETPFIVEWFANNGIEVWSAIEGQQRFDSHVDKLTNYIRFWQASGESQKTQLRVREKKRQMTLQGLYTGGSVRYGLKLVPSGQCNRKGIELKRYEIDPMQYEGVRLIKEKLIYEGWGTTVIASELNARGFRTNTGSSFTATAVLRILRNPLSYGYTSDGETSEALQKLRLFNEDEEEIISRILDQRSDIDNEKRQTALRVKAEALLADMMFCAHCGGRITTTHHLDRYKRKDGSLYKKDTLKYCCYHKSRKLCKCEGQTNYVAEKIDRVILELIHEIFAGMSGAPEEEGLRMALKKQNAANLAKLQKLKLELEKSVRQLKKLQLEIAKALTGDSVYSSEDLADAIQTVKSRVEDEQNEIEGLEEGIREKEAAMKKIIPAYRTFKSWADEFDNASDERKKMIISQLFDRIELGYGYHIHLYINLTYQQFCSKKELSVDAV